MKKWANELNRNFSKDEGQMVKNTHEQILIIHDDKGNANQKHIKIPLNPVEMATIKNTKNNRWQGCGEKGILIHCWWKCKLVQTRQKQYEGDSLKECNSG
jgi:hypothetical protein